ncbi:MAG: metalloregulator ArsR/SmtB family transcription factor [Ilumatobacteraceae bacterium]
MTDPDTGPLAASDPLDELFAALADPTRRALLLTLLSDGQRTATQLAATSPLSRQAVTKHLAALLSSGLVSTTRAGREVRYTATPEPLTAAVGWLMQTGARWDERIERLRGVSERQQQSLGRSTRG